MDSAERLVAALLRQTPDELSLFNGKSGGKTGTKLHMFLHIHRDFHMFLHIHRDLIK